MQMVEWALYYAQMGMAVFPVQRKGKAPIFRGGFKNATTDPDSIREAWKDHPYANIGVATGKVSGGIFVIDLDVDEDKGMNGYDTLRDWERDNGELPETINSITGRGGYHYFFHADRTIKSRTGILDGIDIRGDGGYVVVPPSLHRNGNRYEWEQSPEDFAIAEANETVYKLISIGRADGENTFSIGAVVGEGIRNDTMFKLACSLQAKGLSDETIIEAVKKENQLKCIPPLDDEELKRTIESALSKEKGRLSVVSYTPKAPQYITLNMTGEGDKAKVVQSIENACTVLREDENLHNKIRLNCLSYNVFVCGKLPWGEGIEYREWTDTDDSNLLCYIERQYGLKNKDNTLKALDIVSSENAFNPITQHLDGLPKWDGQAHIENLLPDYLGVEKTRYSGEVMKLFMIGAISRACEPGCKFDYMIVLVGEQGIGKSTFLRRLAMSDAWYDDNFNTVEGDKAVERLRGMWFVELAELLAAKRQKEVESIKAFLTSTIDTYRPPYGRRTVQRPRRCVFAGTTNNEHFLTDVTGNRRYLPLRTNRRRVKKSLFDDEGAVRADIEQAWAEALHIYKTEHPRLIMPKDLYDDVNAVQESFLEEDPRVGIIQSYLDGLTADRVCVMQIWEDALKIEVKPKRKESNEIHDIMRNSIVGWTDIGRKKTVKYGTQICYEREKQIEGFYETDDGEF